MANWVHIRFFFWFSLGFIHLALGLELGVITLMEVYIGLGLGLGREFELGIVREFELGLGLPMITTSSNICGSSYSGFFQPLFGSLW